jgi:cation diffusion facilitator CzcD-associated flavoprotein CzcO
MAPSQKPNSLTNGFIHDLANGVLNGVSHEEEYSILEEPLNTSSPVSVVCIGSGVSGIATAIRVQETLQNCDFTIYEKNDDLGGTWLENRYPGCACDVPAHAYTYTFEPNPDYSRYYVGSVEIHAYLKAVAKKHDVEKYVVYNHKIIRAIWNESLGLWELDIEISKPGSEEKTLFQRTCNILINASGLLNNWKWPVIPGLNTFKGHLCHSAQWKDYDYQGKTVAIIGSGSSAIQIVPELQPIVGQMKSFIRSPTWIAPSQGFVDPKNEGPKNFYYSAEEKRRFRENPDEFLAYRKKIESDMNRTFDTFLKDSPKQKAAKVEFAKIMKARLGGNEELAEKLTPKWGVGCRRLTPGQNFLESLVKPNVEVITNEIDRIEPEGLVTSDGKLHKVDALICATGFNTTYRPRFELVGRQEVPLADLWKETDDVEAYLAVAIPGFPNYFMFMGPNAPISNGTLIPVIEQQCAYMVKFISKLQRQKLHSFCVKPEVVKQLNQHHQKFLQRMVFSDPCRSWYKGGRKDGKVM